MIPVVAIMIAIFGVAPVWAQSLNDSGLRLTEVATGLSSPTNMAFIGANDILVLQKNDGRVRRVINGVLQAGEVLDLAVDSNSERGLLGIALHPDFAANGFVYLYFTRSSSGGDTTGTPAPTDNRVSRYTWNGSKLVNPTQIAILPVTLGPNHNGGIITFGPDGKLYIIIGELNRNGQLQNFPAGPAPDDTGVILRLNDDGTVPSDNPFAAQGGNLAKYYAYGVRNSFGMTFDPVTGKLWDTENGPNNYDEINLVNPGFNSGWEQIMGPDALDPQGVGDLFVVPGSHYADPKFSWFTTVAPTAIVFLNTKQLGLSYENDAFVGDINNGRLYRFKPNATRDGFVLSGPLVDLVADNGDDMTSIILGTGFAGITDLKVGPDSILYVLSYGLGKIFSIERRLSVVCPTNSLQAAINNAIPGDTITVAGPCAENIVIANEKQRIALSGNTATINGPNSGSPTVSIRGKGILVQGFTVTGGSSGISVNRGSNAVVSNNTIQTASGDGVVVEQLGYAVLTGNTIQSNPGAGVIVAEGSVARVGFNNDTEITADGNTIQSNTVGIVVMNQSSARIVGNTISGNNGNGVLVLRKSQADLSSNVISGNMLNGIEVKDNSLIQLSEDIGTNIYETPNSGSGNTGNGVKCTTGSVADGRIGTLTGNAGAKNFTDTTCSDSLN